MTEANSQHLQLLEPLLLVVLLLHICSLVNQAVAVLHFTFMHRSAISPFLAGLPHSPRLSLPLSCLCPNDNQQTKHHSAVHIMSAIFSSFALDPLLAVCSASAYLSLSVSLSLSLALLLPGLRGRSKPPGHQGPPAFDGLLEGSEGSTMLGPKWHELGVLLLCCFGLSSCFRTFELSLALARSLSLSFSLL